VTFLFAECCTRNKAINVKEINRTVKKALRERYSEAAFIGAVKPTQAPAFCCE
jgi:hypothetical protein